MNASTTPETGYLASKDYYDVLKYINQMPGLQVAVDIGKQARIIQHLTVGEMCDSLSLSLDTYTLTILDEYMANIAQVLTLESQSYRVSIVGGCSFTVRTYPGCLFPFFLNVLKVRNISYA